MQRRSFVYGAAVLSLSRSVLSTALFAKRRIPAPCSEKVDTSANLAAQEVGVNTWLDLEKYYPLPKLKRINDFELRIQYVKPSGLRSTAVRWHDEDQTRINRAVQMMNLVWSSEEFMKAVSGAPLLWWKYTKPSNDADRRITGLALYEKLMSVKAPELNIDLTNGSASASTGGDTTTFRIQSLRKNNVYQICNTISHEYTHSTQGGQSEDWGYQKEPDASIFVSYGIGGLTERLACGQRLYGCDLTPNAPQSVR